MYGKEYCALPQHIQRVDMAKYAIADAFGGVVSDLDVIPLTHLDSIVTSPCTFDFCSRAHIIANDFFYSEIGLPCIFEYFATNLARINTFEVYDKWKMRYVFQTTGPDFFTRYLKMAKLNHYAKCLSSRTFLDSRQDHRARQNPDGKLKIIHHLSWKPHVCSATKEEDVSTD